MHRRFLALALAGATVAASAQILGAPPGTPEPHALPEAPEWQEIDAPAPPPLRTRGLIEIDVRGSSLHFGVDPASIAVGKDGVVRYVVVATSKTGAVNGLYEGIRCEAGDVKVYARYNPDSGWVRAQASEWVPLNATPNSSHAEAIARSGVCFNRSVNGTPAQIIRDLRSPVDRRFERGGVNQ
jgi:hypothetical protein